MMQALVNGRIFGPQGLLAEHAVLFTAGRIIDIVREDDPRVRAAEQDREVHDLHAALLLPGFIDLQVNGGGGVLFNDEPTVAGIRAIGEAHRRHGTTGFLPTLISDDLSVVAQAIAAVQEAIATGVPGVMGIHIEGPYLNQLRKGVHNPALIRRPDADIVALLSGLSNGTTLVTLAPEVTTPEVLKQLHARGVVLSAGHTNATYADISTALAHGLTGFTHLFNAMSQLTGREPGVVGAALKNADSYCGIIVDGHHVDPVVLNIALSAKRHDRFMLVTDAMPCAGTDLTSFMLQGRRISVRGDYCVDDAGTLAGTALTMDRAVRNAIALLGLPQATAIRMASQYPADFLGRGAELGRIAPGCRANFVAVDAALTVQQTWINGAMLP
jgi:N-acetylglucosamine-6-phosphate deacetylase